MPNLQFAYATPHRTIVPAEVAQALPTRGWQVSSCELDAIENLKITPDFMWVNFGKSPKLNYAETVLRHLAHLQETTSKHPFFFISGSAPKTTHHALVQCIYAAFPHPMDVVADLAGKPDVSAAIVKFLAQRNARAHCLASTTKPSKPIVYVANADLRSDRGRLSIELIATVFGLKNIEIGRLIGRENKAALSKTPDAPSLQEALKPFADIALLRSPDFGNDAFRKWLNTPNEHMQNRAPIDWIREGRFHDVAGFVYGILTGQPT